VFEIENWSYHFTHSKTHLLKQACFFFSLYVYTKLSGFGGLEVACWTLVPKFVGSNPLYRFTFPLLEGK
jgi:hypothetical protein